MQILIKLVGLMMTIVGAVMLIACIVWGAGQYTWLFAVPALLALLLGGILLRTVG